MNIQKNIISIFFFSVVFTAISFAQPVKTVKYETMIKVADENLDKGDYYNALEWYEKAYDEKKDKSLAVLIGDLQFALRDYVKAERWYNRILKRDRDGVFESIRYEYALALKAQGKYQEALNELNKVISTTEDEEVKAGAKLALQGIEMMDKYADNLEAVVTYGDKRYNSAYEEYSPTLSDDGTLYFASYMRKDILVLDGKEDDYHAKIYTTSKDKKGRYEKPSALGKQINREGFHVANVSFSKDGQRMYFTRSKMSSSIPESTKIFMSNRSGNGWGAPAELPVVNGDWLATHPMEGELFGNPVLFFVSDMDGGYGGKDIYYATIQGDSYATPVNLGEKINTSGEDITPFYRDGTLYFSSDGYPGLGGLDIVFSTWDGTGWGEVTNMGFNYNSAVDDFYYKFNENTGSGHLVSNRPAKGKRTMKSKTCCSDIFEINIRQVVVDLLALINDKDGPLLGASGTLIDLSVDETDPVSKSNFSANDLSFLLETDRKYKAVFTKEGYYPDSITFNTVGILDDYTVKKTITLDKREPEMETITINQPIRLNNIYYDFDDDQILEDAEKDLSYLLELMNQYPDMVIELSSHTDSRGVTRYNRDLSQRRANSAKRWLEDKGVSGDRIKPVGYGEDVLLNRCANGVRCSEEEHAINRRTEFKIIAGPQSIQIEKTILKGAQG